MAGHAEPMGLKARRQGVTDIPIHEDEVADLRKALGVFHTLALRGPWGLKRKIDVLKWKTGQVLRDS